MNCNILEGGGVIKVSVHAILSMYYDVFFFDNLLYFQKATLSGLKPITFLIICRTLQYLN